MEGTENSAAELHAQFNTSETHEKQQVEESLDNSVLFS